MTQKEFNEMTKRYLEGDSTPEEDKMLEEWFNKQKFPAFKEEIHDSKCIEKGIWDKVTKGTGLRNTSRSLRLQWLAGAAAAVTLLASLGFLFFHNNSGVHTLTGPEMQTDERNFILPDGTYVVLGKNSEIKYNDDFNKAKRSVILKGSAYFDVKPDPSRPFRIYSGDLVTEVLGTSFEIVKDEDHSLMEIKVLTGKVSVFNTKEPGNSKVVLKPNQKAVFSEVSKKLVPALVDNPAPLMELLPEKKQFVFKNSPLKEVTEIFHEVYGIDFQILDAEIKNCSVNADLEGLSMYTKLELICKSIEASYEVKGTTVFIKGEGCN